MAEAQIEGVLSKEDLETTLLEMQLAGYVVRRYPTNEVLAYNVEKDGRACLGNTVIFTPCPFGDVWYATTIKRENDCLDHGIYERSICHDNFCVSLQGSYAWTRDVRTQADLEHTTKFEV